MRCWRPSTSARGDASEAVHEYSIALDMWESVAAAARQHGSGRVRSITLEIGALNLIEEEQLGFWIRALAEREGSPEVELRITLLPARVRCRSCAWEGEVAVPEGSSFYLPAALQCAACGSREVDMAGGRELRVVSAEVENGAEDGNKR
jgi:hydrogenase nickel incorporation protein HypA/HybF